MLHQLFKFAIVGAANTAIDFSIYTGLTRFFYFWRENYLLANFIVVAIAGTSSFIWNKFWTFSEIKNNKKQIIANYFFKRI